MEIIGFIGVILIGLYALAGAFAVLASSGWNGKIEIFPLILCLIVSGGCFYTAYENSPFHIELNRSQP